MGGVIIRHIDELARWVDGHRPGEFSFNPGILRKRRARYRCERACDPIDCGSPNRVVTTIGDASESAHGIQRYGPWSCPPRERRPLDWYQNTAQVLDRMSRSSAGTRTAGISY